MRYTTFPIFEDYMFYGSLDDREYDWSGIIFDVNQALNECKLKDDTWTNSYTTYFYHDINKKSLLDKPWAQNIARDLKNVYREYMRGYGHDYMDQVSDDKIHFFAWANKYEYFNWHSDHKHPNSLISGTLYLYCGPTSSKIQFKTPYENQIITAPSTEVTYLSEKSCDTLGYHGDKLECPISVSANTKQGDFLMWPSYQTHCVDRQGTFFDPSYERISLSFNLAHDGSTYE